MRTRKFREAPEKERQEMAVRHRAFTEAEKQITALLKKKPEGGRQREAWKTRRPQNCSD